MIIEAYNENKICVETWLILEEQTEKFNKNQTIFQP